MIEKLSVVLLVLWALGVFALNVGGMIHIILVLVTAGLIVKFLQARKDWVEKPSE